MFSESTTIWSHYNENVMLIKQTNSTNYYISLTGCDDYANWSMSILCFISNSRTIAYFKYISATGGSGGYNGGYFEVKGYGNPG